jgi:hypothetical protein
MEWYEVIWPAGGPRYHQFRHPERRRAVRVIFSKRLAEPESKDLRGLIVRRGNHEEVSPRKAGGRALLEENGFPPRAFPVKGARSFDSARAARSWERELSASLRSG